jgi:poly(A) polymerase
MSRLPGLTDGQLKNLTPLQRGPLSQALKALNGEGEETRLVGGAVRDLALGVETKDFDLATTALPDEVIRRARLAGFKVAPTGLSHGTVTLILAGQPIETTTLREDIETDGRRAKVVFGRDFLSDARRRDFTINALSLDSDGRLHDPLGGIDDLIAGRVRFVGDAEARIREDYLRILRFFRFCARFGEDAIDAEGLRASIRLRGGIDGLSRERVRAELLKLIVSPHASAIVRVMGECGFLEPIFGGIAYPGRLERLIAIESAHGADGDSILRLAALCVVIAEDAERLCERLRLTRAACNRMVAAAAALPRLHGIETPPSSEILLALLFEVKRRAARDALLLAQADAPACSDDLAFLGAHRLLAREPTPTLSIRGADLIARGVSAGPLVGEILRAFEASWAKAGFPNDVATIDLLLSAAIKSATPQVDARLRD